MNERDLDDDIEGVAAAHLNLLHHLDELVDAGQLDPSAASALPDWTVGHVLTHLARNADGLRAMIEGAGRGETAPMYPGGLEQRNADIEHGARRDAETLLDDVRRSIWKLDESWVTLDADGWAGAGLRFNGDRIPIVDIPFIRWREVEVHHADLGLADFTIDDWSNAYVAKELATQLLRWKARRPMGMAGVPPEVNALNPQRRLAWLLGRFDVDGLQGPGGWS